MIKLAQLSSKIIDEIQFLYSRRKLIVTLSDMSHKTVYHKMVLGSLWWYLEPFLFLFVYWFFVDVVMGRAKSSGGSSVIMIFSGLVIYQWTVRTLARAPNCIVAGDNILLTIPINPIIFAASMFYEESYRFVGSLVVFLVMIMFLGAPPLWSWIYIPLVVLPLLVLHLVLAIFFGVIGVFIRDLVNLTSVIARILVFVSPVLYEVSRIPESLRGIYMLNPLAIVITNFRQVVLKGLPPDIMQLSELGIFAMICLFLSFWLIAEKGQNLAKQF